MKKMICCILLVLSMVLSFIPAVPVSAEPVTADPLASVADLPGQNEWSYDGIAFCMEHGYMLGTSASTFSPSGVVTRGQLVTVIYRIYGSPETTFTGRFTDVPESEYYAAAVQWAADNGIVHGTSETTFDPEASITREQIAAILHRYCGNDPASGSIAEYPDASMCEDYAVESMCWAVENGLIKGTAEANGVYLQPKQTATRDQIATILMRLLNIVEYSLSTDAYQTLDDYLTQKRIKTDIDHIIRPYLDENGEIENDPQLLEQAAQAVSLWAEELASAGIIRGSALYEPTQTVSFFLNDGTTSLYVPPLKDAYSGGTGDQFTVMSVSATGSLSNAFETTLSQGGSAKAAEEILNGAPEYTLHWKDKGVLDDLRLHLGSLKENNVGAIFWRGHGDIYRESNGENLLALIVSEKSTRTSEENYRDALTDGGSVPKCLARCGDYYAVNPYFFKTYTDEVDSCLFYCGSCYSASDGGYLCTILDEKGFSAYCGSVGAIMIAYSDKIMRSVAENLTKLDEQGDYTAIDIALSQAKAEHGEDWLYHGEIICATEAEPYRIVSPIGYKAAYAEVLKTRSKSETFILTHVDGDDIPELIVFEGSHHTACAELYTYYNGEAVHIGDYAEYGYFQYVYKGNLCFSGYMQHGYISIGYSKIENGTGKMLFSHSGPYDEEYFDPYENVTLNSVNYSNGKKITAANISAMIEDISGFLYIPE